MSEFPLDSIDVSFLKYEFGKLFYKDFADPLLFAKSDKQYVVAQFDIRDGQSLRTLTTLLEDACISYPADAIPGYVFPDPEKGNPLIIFLKSLGKMVSAKFSDKMATR